MSYNIIIYQALTNPYVRFVRVTDGYIWDSDNEELAAAPTWADTAIILTKNDYIGGVPITVPADLPVGEYDILLYDSASPADTDEVVLGKRISWTSAGGLINGDDITSNLTSPSGATREIDIFGF